MVLLWHFAIHDVIAAGSKTRIVTVGRVPFIKVYLSPLALLVLLLFTLNLAHEGGRQIWLSHVCEDSEVNGNVIYLLSSSERAIVFRNITVRYTSQL